MLHIAVCDDEQAQLSFTQAMLERFIAARPELQARIACFSSAAQLLDRVDERGAFDIYILDVIMPEMGGIELGLELRRRGDSAFIIYLTTSRDFAVDSYLAQAYHYLLKPVEERTLFNVLDGAVGHLAAGRDASVAFRQKDGLRRLRLDSIVYGELFDRCIRLHLADGETADGLTLRQSFKDEAAPFLAHRRFALCSASFFVNLAYIEKVERDGLRLKDGVRLPLSRAQRDEVTNRWIDFCLNGEGFEC